jgi:DNA-binding response OmpR family regulator
VFSREQILSPSGATTTSATPAPWTPTIKRIRQKLPQEGVPWSLKTVYGVGYKFEVDE